MRVHSPYTILALLLGFALVLTAESRANNAGHDIVPQITVHLFQGQEPTYVDIKNGRKTYRTARLGPEFIVAYSSSSALPETTKNKMVKMPFESEVNDVQHFAWAVEYIRTHADFGNGGDILHVSEGPKEREVKSYTIVMTRH